MPTPSDQQSGQQQYVSPAAQKYESKAPARTPYVYSPAAAQSYGGEASTAWGDPTYASRRFGPEHTGRPSDQNPQQEGQQLDLGADAAYRRSGPEDNGRPLDEYPQLEIQQPAPGPGFANPRFGYQGATRGRDDGSANQR